jgi:urease accessory protein UreH
VDRHAAASATRTSQRGRGAARAAGNFAATLTDDLLSVRFLSHDNLICQRVMRDIWQSLRPLLTTKTACSPRIWQT